MISTTRYAAARSSPVRPDDTTLRRYDATTAQLALAWLLALAPNAMLIPGTTNRLRLRENPAAGALSLDDEDVALLTAEFRTAAG